MLEMGIWWNGQQGEGYVRPRNPGICTPAPGPHTPEAESLRAGSVQEVEADRKLLVLSFQTPVHRAPVSKVAMQGSPFPKRVGP